MTLASPQFSTAAMEASEGGCLRCLHDVAMVMIPKGLQCLEIRDFHFHPKKSLFVRPRGDAIAANCPPLDPTLKIMSVS